MSSPTFNAWLTSQDKVREVTRLNMRIRHGELHDDVVAFLEKFNKLPDIFCNEVHIGDVDDYIPTGNMRFLMSETAFQLITKYAMQELHRSPKIESIGFMISEHPEGIERLFCHIFWVGPNYDFATKAILEIIGRSLGND